MRPDQYSRWIDPAPLEVERPRLPWWTMAPRKLLLVASPIIAVAVAVMVVVFLARRVWRYPLSLISGMTLIVLWVGCSWWAPVGLLTALGVGCGLWAWQHQDSFHRTVVRQVRSEWRRALVYTWRWRRVMLFTELTKRTGSGLHRCTTPRSAESVPTGGATESVSRCCTGSALRPTPRMPRSWRTPSAPDPAGCGWTSPGGSGWT